MKRIAAISALLLAGCAHKIAPAIDTATVERSVAAIGGALTKIESAKRLADAQKIAQSATKEVAEAQKGLSTIKDYANRLQLDRDWWKDYSTKQEAQIRELQKKLCHFNHLLFLASSLSGILAGLVVGRFAMAFSPYGAFIGVAAGAAAFGAVWGILAHL